MRRRRVLKSIGQSLRWHCAPLSLEALEVRRVLSSASLIIGGAGVQSPYYGPTYLQVLDIEASGGEHVTEGSALSTPPAALDIGFSRAPLLTGGPASANTPANWQLLKDGVDVTSSIVGINYKHGSGWFSTDPLTHVYLVFASPLGPGDYRLTARGTIANLEGALPQAQGTDFVRNFRVLSVSADSNVKTIEKLTGDEPQVSQPVVATAADGSYVMAWVENSRTAVIDATIILQRFSAGGQKLGNKITLDAASSVDSLSIVFLSDGGFVVGWSQDTREQIPFWPLSLNGDSAAPQTTAAEDRGWEVRAQRYDAQGNTIGDSLLVAESVAGSMGGAQVAATANGGFGMAWRVSETNVDTIKFRQYDASGTPLTDVQTLGIGVGLGPQIAASANGAVVVWAEYSNGDLTKPSALGPVRGQRLDVAGAKFGDSFLVSGPEDVSPFAPDVAMDAEGNFIVVWQDGSPYDGQHVFAQRYDATGQVVQSRFQVDGSVSIYARMPAVTMSAGGNFVVSWVSAPPLLVNSGPSTLLNIKARAFDDAGVAISEEFFVDTRPKPQFGLISFSGRSSELGQHSLAMAGENRLIVSWGQVDQLMNFLYLNGFNYQPATVTATSILSRSFTLRSPQVDLNGAAAGANYAGGFRPGLGPVAISGELAITNTADDSLTSARVAIGGFLAGDVLSADTAGTSITASFAAGVLVLTGADSVEHYRQVLASVRFDSTASRALGSKILLAVSVSDGAQAGPPATATLTVYQSGAAWVAGRWLFYDNSRWDNSTFGPSTLDDAAIAPDKTPLLPGQDSSFANISSSTRGLNGFMIDVGGQHGPLSIDDFKLTVGNTADVDSWTAAPTAWITIRPGAGVNGSDRIEFRFEHMAISNQWLRVEMVASANTGLTNNDVFYFGSLPGDIVAPHTSVTGVDAIRLVNFLIAQGEITAAAIDDPLDINRDGWISGGDINSLVSVLYGGEKTLVPLSIPAQAGAGQVLPDLVGGRGFFVGVSGGFYRSGGSTSGYEVAVPALGMVAAEVARGAVVSSPLAPAWQAPTPVAGAATSQAVAVALAQWADEVEADLDLPEFNLVADLPALGDDPGVGEGLALDP